MGMLRSCQWATGGKHYATANLQHLRANHACSGREWRNYKVEWDSECLDNGRRLGSFYIFRIVEWDLHADAKPYWLHFQPDEPECNG